MESALTSKGQVTIPKPMRDHLGLRPGDRVKFFIQPDGHVVILPRIPISALKGMLRTSKRASLADMEAAIAKGATRRFTRSKSR
ncbi:MAG: type II toxin-antitoxin system PrlF family antitoxin [Acidobacteriaceae bacterium]